ncbi:MAG TPA: outer membrane beta-barrel protein [Calditrichia bacterium]|nr:outer membrane beta-barrel protein [Calditrichia bacterium]
MKGFSIVCVLLMALGMGQVAAQNAPRFSVELPIALGNFSLEDDANSNALRGIRGTNRTEASVVGFGIMFGYRVWMGAEAFYNWHYEYGSEPLEDAYSLVMQDFGVRYSFLPQSFLQPFVCGSYTTYVLNDLKVHDPEAGTLGTVYEYDFQGKGFTYGVGVDLRMGGPIGISAEYLNTKTNSFEKKDGNIDFTENKPSFSRWSFNIRFAF